MTLDLLPAEESESPARLIPGDDPSALTLAGQVANQYAARDVFSDYRRARRRTRCGSRMAGWPCLRTSWGRPASRTRPPRVTWPARRQPGRG